MGDMSRTYRHCRQCGVNRDQVPISKRGLCASCATLRALQNVSGAVAISAAVQAARRFDEQRKDVQ
jgi:hypothetical protein